MIGQFSNKKFLETFKNDIILISFDENLNYFALTKYGKRTTNYWIQHKDRSWSNVKCSTNEL